jgi:hypothetical protein
MLPVVQVRFVCLFRIVEAFVRDSSSIVPTSNFLDLDIQFFFRGRNMVFFFCLLEMASL